jgi:hypothetical protein
MLWDHHRQGLMATRVTGALLRALFALHRCTHSQGTGGSAQHGFAADRSQRPLRSRFQARLKRGVDMTSGVKS